MINRNEYDYWTGTTDRLDLYWDFSWLALWTFELSCSTDCAEHQTSADSIWDLEIIRLEFFWIKNDYFVIQWYIGLKRKGFRLEIFSCMGTNLI